MSNMEDVSVFAHTDILVQLILASYFDNQVEDKAKYDAIFDSLNPVNGLLSGDKVKPVLLNSKLPVDILGRVRMTRFLVVQVLIYLGWDILFWDSMG